MPSVNDGRFALLPAITPVGIELPVTQELIGNCLGDLYVSQLFKRAECAQFASANECAPALWPRPIKRAGTERNAGNHWKSLSRGGSEFPFLDSRPVTTRLMNESLHCLDHTGWPFTTFLHLVQVSDRHRSGS